MGRQLGSFADDQELDRPDLNKCPDCNCFFSGDTCPLCGKVCPEEMRAGNRAPVKPKKQHRGSGRVTFIEWYHSWWFIVLMMLFIPIVGIVLLITSPHKTWKKVLFIALAVVYLFVSIFGIFGIFRIISSIARLGEEPPVNVTLSKEEYMASCTSMTVEDICRYGYEDQFISTKVKVVAKATMYSDNDFSDEEYLCYICETEEGSEYRLVIRDCLLADQQRFIAGDVITVYGEGAGEVTVHDSDYNTHNEIGINMAYVVVHND